MTDYCYYCMSELGSTDAICPKCGKGKSAAVPAHHLLPGTLLNSKFRVGMALGEGGFGITYIGFDTKLDIRVAIKEFYPNGYVNRNNTVSAYVNDSVSKTRKEFFEKGRERFLKEARILARFSGEAGVVDVRDFFEENNTAYIVMEYLDGVNLKNYLKENGTLTPEETIKLLAPVMASLRKIHKQGLIHRDISPDNIMVMGDSVKLLDFGAARSVSAEANKSLSVMLKPGYAPEEQYRSKGVQGPWTDVYALCATMYKCITGITPDDATQRVFSDDVKYPSALGIKIPEELEKAIMRGMSIHQKDRYQSVEELVNGMQGVEVTFAGDDKTITASGKKVIEDEIQTRLEVQEDDCETIFGEDVLNSASEIKAESEPEVVQEATQRPELKEAKADVEKQELSAEENQATEEKTEIITETVSLKQHVNNKESAFSQAVPVKNDKTENIVEKADSKLTLKNGNKKSMGSKRVLFGVGLSVATLLVVGLIVFLVMPKSNYTEPEDTLAIETIVETFNAEPETLQTETSSDTSEYDDLTSTDYLLDYQQPQALGTDISVPIISIENQLYQLPCPVSKFLSNGWVLHTENIDELFAGCYANAYLSMNDIIIWVEIGNFSEVDVDVDECAVYGVWVTIDDGIDVCLPGDEPITFGMTKNELENALPDENSIDALYCYDEIAYYSYSTSVSSDLGGGRMVCIDVDKDTEIVESIYIMCDEWTYLGEYKTLDINVYGCPYCEMMYAEG